MKLKHMLEKKRCPKCGGSNVYPDSDAYGCFDHCLQCGYMGDIKIMTLPSLELDNSEEECAATTDFVQN